MKYEIKRLCFIDGSTIPIILKELKGRIYAIVFANGMTDEEIEKSLKTNKPIANDWRAFNTTTNTFVD